MAKYWPVMVHSACQQLLHQFLTCRAEKEAEKEKAKQEKEAARKEKEVGSGTSCASQPVTILDFEVHQHHVCRP